MDFFSNLIKTTVSKVENLSKSNVNQNNDNKNETNDQNTDEDNKQSDQKRDKNMKNRNSESDIKAIERSSSGETSGPDEDLNETIDAVSDDTKAETSQPMTTEAVAQKAVESAKYFGNLLSNFANKAGQTVSATAKQIKQTVEQAGIMQDFTREQQEFIKEHGGKIEISEPPWVGCEHEEQLKEAILNISTDKRNFLRTPPSGVEFAFDMDLSYPTALALLKEDPNLNAMRFDIVPKLLSEDQFWCNYFYRVSLIKQSSQLSSFTNKDGKTGWSSSRSSSGEGPDDPSCQSPTALEPEFISDAYMGSEMSAEEVRRGMRELGVRKDSNNKAAEGMFNFN
jgi:hypothetical protein